MAMSDQELLDQYKKINQPQDESDDASSLIEAQNQKERESRRSAPAEDPNMMEPMKITQENPGQTKDIQKENLDEAAIEKPYTTEDLKAGLKADEVQEPAPKAATEAKKPASEEPKSEKEEQPGPKKQSIADMLKAAQERTDTGTLANQLGRAATIIGAGAARVQPSKEALDTFDQNTKIAQLAVPELKQQLEMAKYDPKSATSQAYREFYTQIMHKEPPAEWSAADLEKVSPMFEKYMQAKETKAASIEMAKEKLATDTQMKLLNVQNAKERNDIMRQYHEQLLALKQQQVANKGDEQARKTNEKTTTLINQIKTRGPGAKAADIVRIGGDALNVMDRYKNNLDQMPQQTVNTVTDMLTRMASGGVTTKAQFDKLGGRTFGSDWENFMARVQGQPTPAQLGGFLKEQKANLEIMRDNAKKTIGNDISRVLETQKKYLDPDDYEQHIASNSDFLTNNPKYSEVLKKNGFVQDTPQSIPSASLAPNEEARKTKDGRTAIFDKATKQFIRYQ